MPDASIVLTHILEFVQADEWESAQAYLTEHQAVLFSDGTEAAFDHLIAQTAPENANDRRIFYTHRALLHRAQAIGIDEAFAEFHQVRAEHPNAVMMPIELLPIVQHLQQTAPTRARVYLDENPDVREQLIALGILQIKQQTSQTIESIILSFINANTWDAKQTILEKNPRALNSPASVIFFEEALQKAQGNSTETYVLEAHQRLLTRAQEIGIDAAFAEAKQALEDAKNAGYDVSPPDRLQ